MAGAARGWPSSGHLGPSLGARRVALGSLLLTELEMPWFPPPCRRPTSATVLPPRWVAGAPILGKKGVIGSRSRGGRVGLRRAARDLAVGEEAAGQATAPPGQAVPLFWVGTVSSRGVSSETESSVSLEGAANPRARRRGAVASRRVVKPRLPPPLFARQKIAA